MGNKFREGVQLPNILFRQGSELDARRSEFIEQGRTS